MPLTRAVDRTEAEKTALDFLIDGAVVKITSFAARERAGLHGKIPPLGRGLTSSAAEEVADCRWKSVDLGSGAHGQAHAAGACCHAGGTGGRNRASRATLNNYGDIQRKRVAVGARGVDPPLQRGHPRNHRAARRPTTIRRRTRRPSKSPPSAPPAARRWSSAARIMFCPNRDGCRAPDRGAPERTSPAATPWTSRVFRKKPRAALSRKPPRLPARAVRAHGGKLGFARPLRAEEG